MELKVWVEGIQRIVCGVTDKTTCQDVVYALAHATGKTGRFTLIERWRNSERLLAPHEQPLKVLMKWGEYSNDVQFILQRASPDAKPSVGLTSSPSQQQQQQQHLQGNSRNVRSPTSIQPTNNIKKSLTFSGGHPSPPRKDNVGVVKGIPQQKVDPGQYSENTDVQNQGTESPKTGTSSTNNWWSGSATPEQRSPSYSHHHHHHHHPYKGYGSPSTDDKGYPLNITNSQHKRDNPPPYREPPRPTSPLSPQKTPPRELPPYRDPPPPSSNQNSPVPPSTPNNNINNNFLSRGIRSPAPCDLPNSVSRSPGMSSYITPPEEIVSGKSPKTRRNLLKEFRVAAGEVGSYGNAPAENSLSSQYRELVRLINHQREKLSVQETDLTKVDAEIGYYESRTREQQQQLEYINREVARLDASSRINDEQARLLGSIEEEHDICRQQEKTLQSEITLLRSKLANCETELLQTKNKTRKLMEDLNEEQRRTANQHLVTELERLHSELEQLKKTADIAAQVEDALEREVCALETAIGEKKQQVERLVREMKDANLQSLAVAPTEEIRHLLEGPHKPGSTRKMIGSPRQLENAVPTSKNPHGVWV